MKYKVWFFSFGVAIGISILLIFLPSETVTIPICAIFTLANSVRCFIDMTEKQYELENLKRHYVAERSLFEIASNRLEQAYNELIQVSSASKEVVLDAIQKYKRERLHYIEVQVSYEHFIRECKAKFAIMNDIPEKFNNWCTFTSVLSVIFSILILIFVNNTFIKIAAIILLLSSGYCMYEQVEKYYNYFFNIDGYESTLNYFTVNANKATEKYEEAYVKFMDADVARMTDSNESTESAYEKAKIELEEAEAYKEKAEVERLEALFKE